MFYVTRKNIDFFIADKDITVYIAGSGFLWFLWFPLDRYKFVYLVNKFSKKIPLIVEKYSSTQKCISTLTHPVIVEGYHSCGFFGIKGTNYSNRGEFIIPKGTKYYYNEVSDLYVSEQIVYKAGGYISL